MRKRDVQSLWMIVSPRMDKTKNCDIILSLAINKYTLQSQHSLFTLILDILMESFKPKDFRQLCRSQTHVS